MSKSCCCYFVNQRYLLPALLSAIQAKANITIQDVDVTIFFFGIHGDVFDLFTKVCNYYGVRLVLVTPDRLKGMEFYYVKFLACDLVDETYEKILLIDADTQIEGSLDDLFRFPLPHEKILATRDPMTFQLDEPTPHWADQRNYLLSLGLTQYQIIRYFNAGVMMCNRQFLCDISKNLLRMMEERKSGLRFYDQDIFNIIIGNNHLDMSLKWNYPVFFDTYGLSIPVKAVVRHFMSKPRPWEGAFHPWGQSGWSPYLRVVELHPELKPFLMPFLGIKRLKYTLQQNFKRYADGRAWRNERIKTAIADYEQHVVV